MEISPLPSTKDTIGLKTREDYLAITITNWLADRPLMRLHNSPSSVSKLLSDEVGELALALNERKNSGLEFDETPGELGDVVFFALTLLRQLGRSTEEMSSMLLKAKKKPQFTTSVENLDALARSLIDLAEKDHLSELEVQAKVILFHVYALGASLGYDLTAQTLEKAAYNHTRYLASEFLLSEKDKVALEILESTGFSSQLKLDAKQILEESFQNAKKTTRKRTKNLGLKEVFYEIPAKLESPVPKQLPIEKPLKQKQMISSRKKLTVLAARFTGFLLGMGA